MLILALLNVQVCAGKREKGETHHILVTGSLGQGRIQSLDWTGGLDWWNGLVDGDLQEIYM